MRRLVLLLLATLGTPILPAYSQSKELLYDGFESIALMQRNVRDVEEVNRTPLFDNAPFLHLRKGDKLVKAKEDLAAQKGKPPAEPDRVSFYVLSDGKYYERWTEEEDGKLLLSPAFYSADSCLLFDWEVTLASAKALRKLLPNEYASSLTVLQYDAIVEAVRKKFPEIETRVGGLAPGFRDTQLISIPGSKFVEFQGFAYDRFRNCVYRYFVRIGSSVFSIHGQTLLQGPPHVEPWEFESTSTAGPNASGRHEIDPKTAKIKRAEYDRMMEFQTAVTDAIRSKAR